MLTRSFFFPLLLWAVLFLSIINPIWNRELAVIYTALTLLLLLERLGNGIVIRESTVFFFAFTCLLMPVVGYKYYNVENYLARIFYKFMMVPEDDYFLFTVPAISLFGAVLCWPSSKADSSDEGPQFLKLLNEVRVLSEVHFSKGLLIVSIGVIMSLVSSYLPASVQFFVNLFFFASFAGFLYIYYSKKSVTRTIVIYLFIAFIVLNAVNTSMFTVIVYMGITMFSFLYVGKKASLFKKIGVVVAAFFLFVVLQNVKLSYRLALNNGEVKENKVVLFLKVFNENIQKGSDVFESNALFPVFIRANQGFNVSLVMRKIPKFQDHDGGRRLAEVFLSAFVPRFLWPTKPEAGGKFNMKYYAGVTIEGWSTNIGPVGEAYGSFGYWGGIAWMGLLAAFIRFFYYRTFAMARRYPLLFCWFPLLFYQVTYAAETDSLQIFNSLIKSVFFIWLLFKWMPDWFGKEKVSVPLRHNSFRAV